MLATEDDAYNQPTVCLLFIINQSMTSLIYVTKHKTSTLDIFHAEKQSMTNNNLKDSSNLPSGFRNRTRTRRRRTAPQQRSRKSHASK